MLVLFALIVMRLSGAIVFHPVFGRSNYPNFAKAALILSLSALMYSWTGGVLYSAPETLLEFGLMLLQELFFGFLLGFSTEVAFGTIRFATSIMDFSMGLNMAQVYDPSTNTQATVSSGLFNGFLVLLFVGSNGHIRYLALLFRSVSLLPFGMNYLIPRLPEYLLRLFSDSIRTGMQIAFPIVGIELLLEVALGILMRVIPQIHIFSINFQMKIISGLLMLFLLLSPLGDRLMDITDDASKAAEDIVNVAFSSYEAEEVAEAEGTTQSPADWSSLD